MASCLRSTSPPFAVCRSNQVEAELREANVVPAESHDAWTAAGDLPDVDVDLSDLENGTRDGGPDVVTSRPE